MKIKELADLAGITPDTVRFYEKTGLLDADHVQRRDNRYRVFNHAALERIAHIKAGQAAGFTLAEIAQIVKRWERGAIDDAEQLEICRTKIASIDAQMARLLTLRSYFTVKLERLSQPLQPAITDSQTSGLTRGSATPQA
jgi:MerR family transcriptional regulator, copper efflux regulator